MHKSPNTDRRRSRVVFVTRHPKVEWHGPQWHLSQERPQVAFVLTLVQRVGVWYICSQKLEKQPENPQWGLWPINLHDSVSLFMCFFLQKFQNGLFLGSLDLTKFWICTELTLLFLFWSPCDWMQLIWKRKTRVPHVKSNSWEKHVKWFCILVFSHTLSWILFLLCELKTLPVSLLLPKVYSPVIIDTVTSQT